MGRGVYYLRTFTDVLSKAVSSGISSTGPVGSDISPEVSCRFSVSGTVSLSPRIFIGDCVDGDLKLISAVGIDGGDGS